MQFNFLQYQPLRMSLSAVALCSLISLTGATALASENSSAVTVHQHVNFNGRSLDVGEGDVTIQQLRRSVGNDTISSISIEPGYTVLACQHSRFRGRCDTFTSDVSDLRSISFNDVISSLRVTRTPEPAVVTAYQHVNFRGRSLDISQPGVFTIQNLQDSGLGNDVISSFQIADGYSVRACEHSRNGGSGRCENFTNTVSDLRTIGFNDFISYLDVTRISDDNPAENTAPVATDIFRTVDADASVTFTIDELIAASTDAEDDTLTTVVTFISGVNQNVRVFTYTPGAEFSELPEGESAEVRISYRVRDAESTSEPAEIIITINGVFVPDVVASASFRVTDTNGNVIPFVSVSSALDGTSIGLTNANGEVVALDLDVPSDPIFRFSSPDYGDQVVPLNLVSGTDDIQVEVTLVRRFEAAVDASNGSTQFTSSFAATNAQWSIGSFVDALGNVANDSDIEVNIATIDVSNPAELEAFPGTFLGTTGGSSETIATLGTSEFTFSLSDGTPLDLANGAQATIELPFSDTMNPVTGEEYAVGDSVPLWSLNEQSGIWEGEGEGEVVASDAASGLSLRAEVSHFSWWNIDVPVPTGVFNISVTGDTDGTALVRAVPTSINSRPASSVVALNGTPAMAEAPSGNEFCFTGTVSYPFGQRSTTDTICASVSNGGSTDIPLTVTNSDAPLAITNADTNTVMATVGFPTQRVRLSPLSLESSVTYQATGLPPGITLSSVDAVSAELAGFPTVAGTFNATVSASNSDGETDSVIITYITEELDLGNPDFLPELEVLINGSFEENDADLNLGLPVAAQRWDLIDPNNPFPLGMEILNFTIEEDFFQGSYVSVPPSLLFNAPPSFWDWDGVLRATFDNGITADYQVSIRVECDFCSPF